MFQHCFAPRPSEIESYWKHVEQHCRWFDDHPGRQAANKKRLLPFCLYGDEINAFKNAENGSICVLGFGSDLAYGNPALERYYLFTAFSEHNSTENTFDDIIRALVPRLRYMFDETSFNWCSAGWRWTYSSTQGDLKFITDRYGLHNFRKNRICDLCECVKKDDNIAMTLADFRETAAYRATHYTHQDYMQSTTPETRSPLFELDGVNLHRFLHDPCHGQLLGTGKNTNGSCLTYLCERSYFAPWPERGIYENVMSEYRVLYPSMAAKAAQSKMISYWLAMVAGDLAARADATPTDKAVSACIYAYVDTLRKMDEYPLLLSEEQSNELYNSGMRHLRLYSYLHRESAKRTGTEVMRNCWLLQPKHHFFYHMCRDCKEQRLNPSYYSLLTAESWIGYIGRVSRRTHRSTMTARTLQRYCTLLFFRLKRIERNISI
ncbi:unnamed protein product [Symbiodinium necroappetens]|uniref:Uncharacterized protein n=1 Tax=Symbiodinium necroappetens TaxID=1628268 RepID=A0A812U5W5_9DINO|nr:unnamed protein product [Symbiodinium necroappetens]